MQGFQGEIASIAIDSAEEYVAGGQIDGRIKVWDILSGQGLSCLESPGLSVLLVVRTLPSPFGVECTELVFHPFGLFLISVYDQLVVLWSLTDKRILQTHTLPSTGIYTVMQ